MEDAATIVRNDDGRRHTAEVTTEGELLAPQVYVLGDEAEHGDAIRAVARTVAEEPNALNSPTVLSRSDEEFGELRFTFSLNELPVMGDGCVEGWLPPFRAQERIIETLGEELPSGWGFEVLHKGSVVLYKE